MQATIQLFAGARDAVGSPSVTIALPAGGTLADLESELLRTQPRLAELVRRSLWAIDGEYADRTTIVATTSDVALIPPVSGG